MDNSWPDLDYQRLKPTVTTVHLWTQIVGKIRLVKTPQWNHSWHVTLYVSSSGLTTGSIPYEQGIFQIDFNFITHKVSIQSSNGQQQEVDIYPRTVSSFYKELFEKLRTMGIEAAIYPKPNEMESAIRFDEDEQHFQYDKEQINLYWQAFVRINNVFTRFRGGFNGKCSPVHFFWGGFDLAVTRFSGREAPVYSGQVPNMSLEVMQEAYSHEVSSCGFWPGSDAYPHPTFYSYAYPTPDNFKDQPVIPAEAFFSKEMGEFLLPYEVVQHAADPEATLLDFLQSTYEAAANSANWNRIALECDFSD